MKIPLLVPNLQGNEALYLKRCISDNWISSSGPLVSKFENKIANFVNQKYGVATVSGTSALHLALLAAGVKPGDKVLIPDWTFAATANAVCQTGAIPYFVGVSNDSWCIDPILLENILIKSKDNKSISAVIAVHALGHPADMDAIRNVCEYADIPLIEDAAGAIGSSYKGKTVGSLGQIAIFSFNGNKIITTGGGGMVVTNNKNWANHIRHLSTQARSSDTYEHDEIGFNYRMTNLNAAVGLAQLERFDEILEKKRNIASKYNEYLIENENLSLMPHASWADSNCWMYSVLCHTSKDANDLISYLNSFDIEANKFWQSLSSQIPYNKFPNLLSDVSKKLSDCLVVLPCSSSITLKQQEKVISRVLSWKKVNVPSSVVLHE